LSFKKEEITAKDCAAEKRKQQLLTDNVVAQRIPIHVIDSEGQNRLVVYIRWSIFWSLVGRVSAEQSFLWIILETGG